MAERATLVPAKEKAKLIQKQQAERRFHLEPYIDNPAFLVGFALVHYVLAIEWRATESILFNVLVVLLWLATILLSLYFAVNKRYPLIYSAYMAAYVAGCEVMWRQSAFTVFYEGGKYLVIVILLTAWMRNQKKHLSGWALFYLLAMISGIIYTAVSSIENFRAVVANTASGPISIFVSLIFFADLKISRDELRRMFVLFIIPIVTVAGVTSYQLYFADFSWSGDSNNALAGDFGANQVSTALGLGWFFAVVLLLLLLNKKFSFRLVPLLLIMVPWFIAQNFLTFSRGGLLGSAGALLVVMLHMIFIPARRVMLSLAIVVGIIFILIIFPVLDRTTLGNLSRRYTEADELTSLSSRDKIMVAEVQLFLDYPLTGVGLGQSREVRGEYGFTAIASHTEYTRVIAEQGVIGIVSNLVLVFFSIQGYRKQQNMTGRAIAAALVVWTLIYLFHSATRTVAPALTFGLAQAVLVWDIDVREEKLIREKPRIMMPPVPSLETTNE